MVGRLELRRRNVADGLEQPPVVEPVHPLERGVLDVIDTVPRTGTTDHLGLEEADDGLGERVVIGVPAGANRRGDAGLGQPLGVADRGVLGDFNRSAQRVL